ncbi:hypothetical protein H6G94_15490 [Nostoc punctiforme FACHB-252]|uniref:Leucine rich repeat variant n=1 Tax=Nostoc punctiforme FACHB-252 TaxID=1357509 RepID=A0ABR8HBK5_NOSPU|nr:hypothetical protein [Nostoc punctiforme]MBD2612657.1 hypothetical protein [Nostoc punctiforme FACHB-252]
MLDDKDFAIASADDTSTSILEKLSSHPRIEIREAVARNPNTSTKTLLKLGKEFPEAIIANPIFNLLLLENPESHFVRLSLARSTTTSEDVIVRLSKIEDEEILCAVAENPKTSLDILEQLVEEPPLFYDDENADESDFDRLFIAIAHNPNTCESLFHQLADTGSTSVQIAIAQNPKAPSSLLTKFADWRNFSMHKALARNPQAPIEILEKLAGENEKEIREMVKNHPNVSKTAIAIIHFMEGKPGTSIELLEKLASDKRASVRLLVASHPSTPAKILEKLAQDKDKDITLKASKNRNANSTVLEFYAESLVKQCQLVSISNVQFYVRDAVELVKRSDITPKVLENLLPMNSYDVFKAIASSPNTPPSILLALTDYKAPSSVDIHFLISLAKNRNTPSEGLEKLYLKINQIQHPNTMDGFKAIATHPNTPVHVRQQLFFF